MGLHKELGVASVRKQRKTKQLEPRHDKMTWERFKVIPQPNGHFYFYNMHLGHGMVVNASAKQEATSMCA